MAPDPRWLEILKASGWQTTAIAVACALFLLIASWGWLPALPSLVTIAAAFALLICGCLALASMGSAALRFFPVHTWFLHKVKTRREQRAARDYLPHMTPQERKIIGYLLANDQKSFTAAIDGGYAMTLISRGIVVRAVAPGQVFLENETPFKIPDHLWKVLADHRDKFPYTPPRKGDTEPHPWRVPWMVQ